MTDDVIEALEVKELTIVTKTPSAAASAGKKGQITWDASYIYVCTADGAWERVAIASW